jgi:hypothetical protein
MFETTEEFLVKFLERIATRNCLGHDLGQLGQAFEKFSNLSVEISACTFEFGRQRVNAAAFFAQ